MIPTLLWRCPQCRANRGLQQTRRWLRPDVLNCRGCGARWLVQRIPGRDFCLVPQNPAAGRAARWLADWYASMKAGVDLQPLPLADLPALEAEQVYWLAEGVRLQAEADDPLPADTRPGRIRLEKQHVAARWIGQGRLALTDCCLAWWSDAAAGTAPNLLSFPWAQVRSMYAIMDYGLSVLVGLRLYGLYFPGESPLPWIHLADLLARRQGRMLTVSHY